ncbi:MAG: multicopper oxidase domain-containing protein, partial [Nitrospinae bacterium]|nr:multicopper oxidase domain-containing protein [Nitrospinota bacterium]
MQVASNVILRRSRRISYILFLASCILHLASIHAEEMLKTSKIKVGDKAPLTDSLKKPHEDGKAIVLFLLSNPMQCEKCEELSQLIKEETEKYKDSVVYISKGGEDIRGAIDEETIQLKKLYGFVTVGQPWTFIIDREGILKKIFIGQISKEELNDAIKQAIEKKTSGGNVREFTFVVAEGNIELNGTKFSVWTYNGTVPGPEIRVKEGDTVRVKLQNKSAAKHGMFFHGLHVPPKVAMQEEVAVEPGYEYVYEFEAKPSGTHLYHCSYNMAEHLDRGLYGAFIVEAKDDGKFDKEFVYIIDDWNSKAAKGESHHGMGHPRDMMDSDITTINGKSITGSPVVMEVKVGERIRIRLA